MFYVGHSSNPITQSPWITVRTVRVPRFKERDGGVWGQDTSDRVYTRGIFVKKEFQMNHESYDLL